jgi:hypothetical protein
MLLFFVFEVKARSPELLKCLGEEERQYHLKKETGPNYDLNQRLIAEMVQVPNAGVKAELSQEICQARGFQSLRLLQLSLKQDKNLFVIPESVSGMQRQITEGMIDDYVEASKEILINYVTQIQAQAPGPNCLSEEIKGLDKLFLEIKYLQEEVETSAIFKNRDLKILDQLKNYRSHFRRCQDRLKKKAKSGSTTPAR